MEPRGTYSTRTVSWLCRNVALLPPRELSRWRNLSLAAWSSVSAASVHSVLELEAEPMLEYVRRESERTGRRITMVHFVGKALALALRRFPDLNCLIRLGRLYPRRDVDIFFPVALDSRGEDLSGAVLRKVDESSLADVADELTGAAYALRKHGEGAWTFKGQGPFARIASRLLMRAGGFVLYTLNLWSPILGFPRDSFGSAAVTDISKFGAKYAFPPLLPVARLPLLVGLGGIVDGGVWENEDWRRQKRLRLSIVFDHRVADGVYMSRLCRHLTKIVEHPETYMDPSAAES